MMVRQTLKGWPYPTGADPISEGHSQIQSLAETLDWKMGDTALRVPVHNGTLLADGTTVSFGNLGTAWWEMKYLFNSGTRVARVSYNIYNGTGARLWLRLVDSNGEIDNSATYDSTGFTVASGTITGVVDYAQKQGVLNYGTSTRQSGEFYIYEPYSPDANTVIIHSGAAGGSASQNTIVALQAKTAIGFALYRATDGAMSSAVGTVRAVQL